MKHLFKLSLDFGITIRPTLDLLINCYDSINQKQYSTMIFLEIKKPLIRSFIKN